MRGGKSTPVDRSGLVHPIGPTFEVSKTLALENTKVEHDIALFVNLHLRQAVRLHLQRLSRVAHEALDLNAADDRIAGVSPAPSCESV